MKISEFKVFDTESGEVLLTGKVPKDVIINDEEYTLWWYDFRDLKWHNLPINENLELVLTDLKGQLCLTLRNNWRKSLFKIAKSGDTTWQKYVPEYLLSK